MIFWCVQGVEKASNFIKKESQAQVLSCEFYEIFKNTLFKRTHPVAVSLEREHWPEMSLKIRPNPSNIPNKKSVFIECSFTKAIIFPMAFLLFFQIFFILFKNVLFFKTSADGCFYRLHVLLSVANKVYNGNEICLYVL